MWYAGNIFCVIICYLPVRYFCPKRCPLKYHTKYFTRILKDTGFMQHNNLRAATLKSSYVFRNAQLFLCSTLYEEKYAVCLHMRFGVTGGIHTGNAMQDDVMAWKTLRFPLPFAFVYVHIYTNVCTEFSNVHWKPISISMGNAIVVCTL